jgi:VIT1/CCC1 family predicted Fe2+/Mn2+ transporter
MASPLDHSILKHGLSAVAFLYFAAIFAVMLLFSGLAVRARTPAIRLIARGFALLFGAGLVVCLIGWAWKSLT